MGGNILKNQIKILIVLSIVLILSGCSEYMEPISAENEGIWNTWIVWPLVSFISYFANLTHSYSIAIIVVTIIIRVVILPLNIKQINNSKKMQLLQPRLKELKEKYNSKDKDTQQQYQKEMMELMSSSGANPMAGCLPVLIQLPILTGIYHAISRMNVTPVYDLGTFLTVPLASPSIIFGIIAGMMQLCVLLTSPSTSNPQMKVMLYTMPLMITLVGLISPAALSMYWIISSFISIVQNLLVYKIFLKDEFITTTQ